MITIEEGIKAVQLARNIIESHIQKETKPHTETYTTIFNRKQGVFVTIHTYPNKDLRGCIGLPLPIMQLKDAIIEAAQSAATRDPRFPPVNPKELDHIQIEVTILSVPEEIYVEDPKEYISQVKIGRDGLIIEQGIYKGLLLPQVPVEQGWNVEEFLSRTCMKAGLPPDAWIDKNTKILKFGGQIFTEVEPRGKIKEKKIDGSDC